MINPQWLELPMSRTNVHGSKDVRVVEVRLYIAEKGGFFRPLFPSQYAIYLDDLVIPKSAVCVHRFINFLYKKQDGSKFKTNQQPILVPGAHFLSNKD